MEPELKAPAGGGGLPTLFVRDGGGTRQQVKFSAGYL